MPRSDSVGPARRSRRCGCRPRRSPVPCRARARRRPWRGTRRRAWCRGGRSSSGPRARTSRWWCSPVVAQAHALQALLVGAVLHGHEAQGGDAQALQVVEHGGLRQAGVGAPEFRGHRGVQPGLALDVEFVEDAVSWRDAGVALRCRRSGRGGDGVTRAFSAMAALSRGRVLPGGPARGRGTGRCRRSFRRSRGRKGRAAAWLG
jgi:hypothetical protein